MRLTVFASLVLAYAFVSFSGDCTAQSSPRGPLADYGTTYNAEDCTPDPESDVCEPVFHSASEPDPKLPSFYTHLKVVVAGSATFFYVRNDDFTALSGGFPAVLASGVFGPFPAGATVKARRGANYYLVWRCSGSIMNKLILIRDDGGDDAENVSCP